VILTYRNFGDVTLNGLDFSLTYYPSEVLTLNGSYSFVSDDFFKNLGGIADVALNASKHKAKAGASYRLPDWDVLLGGQLRYTHSFPMNSGVYGGQVDSYTVVDLNIVYGLPLDYDVEIRVNAGNILNTGNILNAANILNNKHQAFIGAPKIGRMVFAELGLGF
jgi:outer membrane receptor protein involved in Fe transport